MQARKDTNLHGKKRWSAPKGVVYFLEMSMGGGKGGSENPVLHKLRKLLGGFHFSIKNLGWGNHFSIKILGGSIFSSSKNPNLQHPSKS